MNGGMSAFGTKRTSSQRQSMSAFGGKADMTLIGLYVPRCPSPAYSAAEEAKDLAASMVWRAVSNISDLRHILMRKSGRPDFRCHRRLFRREVVRTWMPGTRPGMRPKANAS